RTPVTALCACCGPRIWPRSGALSSVTMPTMCALDTSHNRVLVGYGKGCACGDDPVSLRKTADIRLDAHPEGFQIDETGPRTLSMCRTRVRLALSTLRQDRPDHCRHKWLARIFRARS